MNPGSPYRPGREIARGGMGAVLDARDQKFARSVAMKVMLRRDASAVETQRFHQEAIVLGQLGLAAHKSEWVIQSARVKRL